MIAYVRAVVAAWADALADVVAPADPAVRAAMRSHKNVPAAGIPDPHVAAGGGHPVRTTSELLTEAAERLGLTARRGSHWLDGLYDELLYRAAQLRAHGD